MKKIPVLLLIIFLSCLMAGVYGIIHDQLTYTLSPEYYTEFKFGQFGLNYGNQNERMLAALVGFLATWWVGFIIGTILGLVGFLYKSRMKMFSVTMKALLVTLSVAALTGVLGFVYAKLFLVGQPIENFEGWYIPYSVKDIDSYIMVGSIHSFSYLGGAVGLVVGIIYSIRKRKVLNSK